MNILQDICVVVNSQISHELSIDIDAAILCLCQVGCICRFGSCCDCIKIDFAATAFVTL